MKTFKDFLIEKLICLAKIKINVKKRTKTLNSLSVNQINFVLRIYSKN
jgi:hypothetical protein